MEIELMYIKGINNLDTLYFQNLEEQISFFDSKIQQVINNTYYPPHFTNRIKFSIDDINFNSQINYLRLMYNNKYYYYFINNIEYKNENVFYLDITMDTIQTYMFDINFINSYIDRISINRWNIDGTINRNYIRENLSNANTKLISYNEISDNNNLLSIIISTQPLGNEKSDFGKDSITSLHYLNNTYYSGLYIYCFPLDNNYRYLNYKKEDGNISDKYNINSIALLNYIRKLPSIISINLLNNSKYIKGILGLSFDNTNHIMTTNYDKLSEIVINEGNNQLQQLCYVVNLYSARLNYIISEFSSPLLSLLKNKNVNSKFNYLYIPQILDENYYRLEYGEKVGNTTFPLHKMKKDYLTFYGKYDITTNGRSYFITEENEELDKYNTNIVCNTNENLQLFNNAWLNYQAINEGTLTTGVKLSYMNNLFKTGVGSIPYFSSNMVLTGLNTYANNLFSLSYTNEISNFSNFLMENYNIDKKLQINRENLEGTPDTLRQGNSSLIDIYPSCFSPYKALYVVEDIENVAKRLEMYGYKVNIILGNENLFNKFNNRYYYNIIKTKDLEIDLKNVITDNATIENIKFRFNNGLRLWNSKDIGNYEYDNVEKIELEG